MWCHKLPRSASPRALRRARRGRVERIGAQRGRMEDAVDFTTSWEFIVVACDRSVALFQYFISWACRSALFSNIQTTRELMVREAVLKAGITLLTSLKVLSQWHVDMLKFKMFSHNHIQRSHKRAANKHYNIYVGFERLNEAVTQPVENDHYNR